MTDTPQALDPALLPKTPEPLAASETSESEPQLESEQVLEASGPLGTSQSAAKRRKRHRRVVRQGGEKMKESEAVASFNLVDEEPSAEPQPHGGNDARLIANVPPHWGKS